jgi:uncharacterized membrane protein
MRTLLNTEDRIELWVERQMDKADHRYFKGELTTEEYKNEMKRISYEADVYYSYLKVKVI